MSKALWLAVVPFAFLSACAAPGGNNGAAPAAAAKGASYCWQDRLNTVGDDMKCNWAATTREACEGMDLSTVKKGAVASGPERAYRCPNGQWLVQITTK